MAACSPDLETIVATNRRLGAAAAGDVGDARLTTAMLIAHGWLRWPSLDGADGRKSAVVPLHRPGVARPSAKTATAETAAAA